MMAIAGTSMLLNGIYGPGGVEKILIQNLAFIILPMQPQIYSSSTRSHLAIPIARTMLHNHETI